MSSLSDNIRRKPGCETDRQPRNSLSRRVVESRAVGVDHHNAMTRPMNRRDLLKGMPWALTAGCALGAAWLPGCQQPLPPLKVSSHVWVGYELLFLARELNYFHDAQVRLVEVPTNTASMMALSNREVGMAALTLDEFLLARDGGVDVKAILVFDESYGADAVLVKPEIRHLTDLRGKRIGVESTAVGALMLAKLLESAGLTLADVDKVEVMLARQIADAMGCKIDPGRMNVEPEGEAHGSTFISPSFAHCRSSTLRILPDGVSGKLSTWNMTAGTLNFAIRPAQRALSSEALTSRWSFTAAATISP